LYFVSPSPQPSPARGEGVTPVAGPERGAGWLYATLPLRERGERSITTTSETLRTAPPPPPHSNSLKSPTPAHPASAPGRSPRHPTIGHSNRTDAPDVRTAPVSAGAVAVPPARRKPHRGARPVPV